MTYYENGYVQLPPDSTGKKSAAAGRLIVDYTGEVNPNLFLVGQTVVGQTSGATGEIIGKHNEGVAGTDGQLFLNADTVTGIFQANENILVGATVYATIKPLASLNQIFYQKQSIVDRDYVDRSLKIDEYGSAYIQFPDGPGNLTTFGELLTSSPETIREYCFRYNGRDDEFYKEISSSGEINYNSNESSVTLDTGGSISGCLARKTSHYYHPYQPGTATRIMQSVVVGDSGKSSVRRRWGLFDDNDGVFWELDETTLYLVIRSSTTGSPVDTRVQQSDWNHDQLDGTQRFTIDLTKANLYWIEFQWLGVGVVKAGVYENSGRKTTAHIFENPNANTVAYMKTGSLPVRFECENINTAPSSSELKTICSVVQKLGREKGQFNVFSHSTPVSRSLTQASGEVPLISTRSATTFSGKSNKNISVVSSVSVANFGESVSIIRMRRPVSLLGPSFSSVSGSLVEVDTTASGLLYSGTELWSRVIGAGETVDFDFLNKPPTHQDNIGMLVAADGTTQPTISLTAQAMQPTGSGNFIATINWKDQQ